MVKVSFNGEDTVVDFSKDSNLLVHGRVGMGVSNFLYVTIDSLQNTYSEDEVELILLDTKQVNFSHYRVGYDKLIKENYCLRDNKEKTIMENRLQRLFLNRTELLTSKGYYNIEQALTAGEKLTKTVVIVDELHAWEDEDIIDQLIRLGRAVGIYVVAGTHSANEEVISKFSHKVEVKREEAYGDGKTIVVPLFKFN